ncbi:hypothetical protein [Paenibacillus kobensis]|uniref:hypothetical protein n=1 Tax=Paenibacillus kobensis TaxID=59841 RepID=UPI000FD723E2|nr:hypothetical protein [Paenibacillus kobensis]
MRTFQYTIYAAVLGVIAWFTQEFVTFVLLGFILIALNNILAVLNKIHDKLGQRGRDEGDGGNG